MEEETLSLFFFFFLKICVHCCLGCSPVTDAFWKQVQFKVKRNIYRNVHLQLGLHDALFSLICKHSPSSPRSLASVGYIFLIKLAFVI